jgi:hypothetical protein
VCLLVLSGSSVRGGCFLPCVDLGAAPLRTTWAKTMPKSSKHRGCDFVSAQVGLPKCRVPAWSEAGVFFYVWDLGEAPAETGHVRPANKQG